MCLSFSSFSSNLTHIHTTYLHPHLQSGRVISRKRIDFIRENMITDMDKIHREIEKHSSLEDMTKYCDIMTAKYDKALQACRELISSVLPDMVARMEIALCDSMEDSLRTELGNILHDAKTAEILRNDMTKAYGEMDMFF